MCLTRWLPPARCLRQMVWRKGGTSGPAICVLTKAALTVDFYEPGLGRSSPLCFLSAETSSSLSLRSGSGSVTNKGQAVSTGNLWPHNRSSAVGGGRAVTPCVLFFQEVGRPQKSSSPLMASFFVAELILARGERQLLKTAVQPSPVGLAGVGLSRPRSRLPGNKMSRLAGRLIHSEAAEAISVYSQAALVPCASALSPLGRLRIGCGRVSKDTW